jgi:hypothetical protein
MEQIRYFEDYMVGRVVERTEVVNQKGEVVLAAITSTSSSAGRRPPERSITKGVPCLCL